MIYVDDMRAKFGRMTLCHMIGNTDAELHDMADKIGVARKWFQGDHYDIALSKRQLAITLGAQPITWRTASAMMYFKRRGLAMPDPWHAVTELQAEYLRRKVVDMEPSGLCLSY